ncbi:DNA polymerase beta domain protein region [Desulfofarcimen acetoxidans DSM 771]|uniref:DNA polymerase beta domain protein region n=1 Tax=Desulfofarcimen acetoxidans (strain ATCC 49208 / DSM 771 / KCTC 5769 / VKM B-1644 / 5575) TaxID=485916 RepID=C8VY61_DESAS|nr:nucleotidyltransferase domain-containing protein [Desulfofarcimen acetoxidans]ACV64690.1 DNA polymerase beta domain protein region [Desulfofarcimen acetoxidans DSM 771]
MEKVEQLLGAEKCVALRNFIKEQKDVVALYLFGSILTEYYGSHSDLDLGIVFFTSDVKLERELELDVQISDILGTEKVDLINLNKTPVQLSFQAISKGVLIQENDYIELSNFLEKTMKFYGDYCIDLEYYYSEYRKSLREAFLNG